MDDGVDMDAEEAERQVRAFIHEADRLDGPPVATLADEVGAVVDRASREIAAAMQGQRHNKVLAAYLLLGQRARELTASDPRHWRLLAASTLMSPLTQPASPGEPAAG
ncbi:MAG: hypothetical protein ACRD0D_03410 [Acidimicrobiales bacterium]